MREQRNKGKELEGVEEQGVDHNELLQMLDAGWRVPPDYLDGRQGKESSITTCAEEHPWVQVVPVGEGGPCGCGWSLWVPVFPVGAGGPCACGWSLWVQVDSVGADGPCGCRWSL